MPSHDSDAFDTDFSRRRVFQEFDQAVREANRAAIAAAIGVVTKEQVMRVAIAVSQLRARYLREVLMLSHESGERAMDPTAILDLRQMREAYEEALNGFGALRHALERGYYDLTKG